MTEASAFHMEFTDSNFVFAGRSYSGIPVIVDPRQRFVEPVCDYLRYLVLVDRVAVSSAKTYAEYLMDFWKFLDDYGIDYQSVCDGELIQWQNIQEKRGVGSQTIAARCDAVTRFYIWAELNALVQQAVRIPGWNDKEKFTPQISVVPRKPHSRRHTSSVAAVVAVVRPKVRKPAFLPVPNSEDISNLYIAAAGAKQTGVVDRNTLLIDWYVQVGVRRVEWSSLTLRQIPQWTEIYSLRERRHVFELRLTKTKGGRARYVGVLSDLLETTREYIEGPRAEIVGRFLEKKNTNYREPEEIFLSYKTGLPLTLRSISNLLSSLFEEANVTGHGHRLRAAYLTNLFEAEIEAEELRVAMHPEAKLLVDYEMILHKVAERAGHAQIESLRSYITLIRKSRARRGLDIDIVALKQDIEAKQKTSEMLERRIAQQRIELTRLKSR